MKTIALPEEVYQELIELKVKQKEKTAAELITKLVIEYKKKKFIESSTIFKQRLKERKISFEELLKKSRSVREEISDEWF